MAELLSGYRFSHGGVRLSRHFPIPVAVLARRAADARSQGETLGLRLLDDALERVCRAAQEVAVRAVVVHAIDDRVAGFFTSGSASVASAGRRGR
jgi:hypothetical protein